MQVIDRRKALSIAPIWRLAFRPFFLAGSVYALLAIPLTLLAKALLIDTEALNLTGSVTTNDKGAPQSLGLIRAGGGTIIAAVSVSSTVLHMDDARVAEVAPLVVAAAAEISAELGYAPG